VTGSEVEILRLPYEERASDGDASDDDPWDESPT
jgi:hypothetical protein